MGRYIAKKEMENLEAKTLRRNKHERFKSLSKF